MCSGVRLLCRGARGHALPHSCLQQYTHPSVEPMGHGVQESFPNMSWNWSSRTGFQSKPSTSWCPSPALPGAEDRHRSLAGAQVRSSKQTPGSGAARNRSFKAAAEGILSIQNPCLWITNQRLTSTSKVQSPAWAQSQKLNSGRAAEPGLLRATQGCSLGIRLFSQCLRCCISQWLLCYGVREKTCGQTTFADRI